MAQRNDFPLGFVQCAEQSNELLTPRLGKVGIMGVLPGILLGCRSLIIQARNMFEAAAFS